MSCGRMERMTIIDKVSLRMIFGGGGGITQDREGYLGFNRLGGLKYVRSPENFLPHLHRHLKHFRTH
jgi:hypothetical protein